MMLTGDGYILHCLTQCDSCDNRFGCFTVPRRLPRKVVKCLRCNYVVLVHTTDRDEIEMVLPLRGDEYVTLSLKNAEILKKTMLELYPRVKYWLARYEE